MARAITDTTMSSVQRYAILNYFGYTNYEIKQVYHDLSIAVSQEEDKQLQQKQQQLQQKKQMQQIKKQIESIIKDTIKNIKDF